MKHSPIDITLGKSIYSVRISPQDRDHFYELMRQGSLNRVTYHYPLLDDSQIAALWTIFSNSGMASHRMIIEHVLEHLTSVSGSLDQAPIEPSTMIADMVNALPDDE